tara:strand:+ start:998 stop:2131 length:1134 start_codon:yes stop_codon:yes gene_type:complete
MINPEHFLNALKKAKINFFTGVPDSLLKEFCACLQKKLKKNHIISTNEGSAIGLAIGHFLASRKPALVYMQNSGLGNAVNPITSLASSDVYGIPMVLLIGWRGEISTKKMQIPDEPQHKHQGKITLAQLDLMNIPYKIISEKTKNIHSIVKKLKDLSLKKNKPVAIVVRKNTFSKFKTPEKVEHKNSFFREDAIKEIVKEVKKKNIIVSTTGMASRELFETRKILKQDTFKDFLTVGGMGHANQIATGIALHKPKKKIICIDGDGAILMHMGSIAISAQCKNMIHVVINNKAHDSVGGQPTKGEIIDFTKISKACGYSYNKVIIKKAEIRQEIKKAINKKNNSLLVINCQKGYRKNLGRPNQKIKLRKEMFIKSINN